VLALTQGEASKRSARQSRTVRFISVNSGSGGKSFFVSSAIPGLVQHYGQASLTPLLSPSTPNRSRM
jgi:hypothetical protein